jgi:tRNA(Ile)-lysidine synthase
MVCILIDRVPVVSRLIQAISEFFQEQQLPGTGLVAVSGGADSVALLRGLLQARVSVKVVVHFNHQLRGEESDQDEQFVLDLARQLGVDCVTTRRDIQTLANETKRNLEEVARTERYEFFSKVAEEKGCSWIATGHNANDQAETALHRLIRGTGLQGLRGVAPIRTLPNGTAICRPLLRVSRSEIVSFLEVLGQPFRTDSTNASLEFTRNRIRSELLPLMQSFNPDVVNALSRTASQAEEIYAYISGIMEETLNQVERPSVEGVVILDAVELAKQPKFLIAEVCRRVWERESWPRRGMTTDHWKRLTAIVLGECSAADFPEGLHVRRVGRVVQLSRKTA